MIAARRRIRKALRRLSLSYEQSQLIRLLLRDDRRERREIERLLEECRRQLHVALTPPAPDSATVLELSLRERQLQERQLGLCDRLEERIARLLGPERAAELRTLPPVAAPDASPDEAAASPHAAPLRLPRPARGSVAAPDAGALEPRGEAAATPRSHRSRT